MKKLNALTFVQLGVFSAIALITVLTGLTIKDVIQQKEATKQAQAQAEETSKALANNKATQQMLRERLFESGRQTMEAHIENEAAFEKAKREGDARVRAAWEELQRGREQRARDSAR